ncbi:uncharacterized protein LOC125446602 isoform X1 [Stegostoma tigrinum]|uniref:uncharacterized protein LOC125446602 isoform X1 n=1 Tax=Stegostoma tigrinum TaxID=3053191 RepID=UPI0028704337|nr:uncharacterized protein LOC125446602 isoform X1 [Stegostoma tigrinum]
MCKEPSILQLASVLLLGYYFICLFAPGNSAISLSVSQREVNGSVSQSVRLSVSYSTLTPSSTLGILWYFLPGDTPIVSLIRSNCSSDAARCCYNCSDHQMSAPSHRHRVDVDPETGSLCLRDLQPSDSGVYVIQVYADGADTAVKENVTLTVCNVTDGESTTPAVSTTNQSSTENTEMYIITSAAMCFFIVLICFIYLLVTKKHRGCRLQQDSVVMETSIQSIEGMRQGLTEGQDTLTNSELTYSLLQWSKDRNPQASGADTQETDTARPADLFQQLLLLYPEGLIIRHSTHTICLVF